MTNEGAGTYEALGAAAGELGIACRGGFLLEASDGLPEVNVGRPGRTLVLLGFTGAKQWSAFASSAEFVDGKPDPLDRWSVRLIEQLATLFRARPLYPFGGPPWWPFQRWAQRAESLHQSPLGILMHERYGLWHSYRGALLFEEEFAVPQRSSWSSPCVSCSAKPCIALCPVGAVSPAGFDRNACSRHVASPQGADCRSGCLARGGCPIAESHRYGTQQATFHMRQLT
jgi:hypothetical protein